MSGMGSGIGNWFRQRIGKGALNHDEVKALASDYIDDDLSPSVAGRFRRHIDECEGCNGLVATLRATVLTLRDLPKPATPPDLKARVLQSVQEEGEKAPATETLDAPAGETPDDPDAPAPNSGV